MSAFSLFSGLVPAVLQAVVLAIFIRRRLYRRFPFFFAYTVYSILVTALRLSIMSRPRPFFVWYWSTEIIYGILALLAIHEVFKSVLEMYYSLYRWMRWLPPFCLLLILSISLWRAVYHPVGRGPLVGLAAGAYSFMLGVLGIQVMVFLLCLKLSFRKHYPIRWTRYEAGILIGFGMAAIATMLVYLARFRLGPSMELAFRYIPPVAYIAAALMWLKAFYREEPPVMRKRTDPELFKKAADFMRGAVEDTETHLGIRSSVVPNW